ncbi:hypothetical protein BLNAU_22384 [Blattamonas nauphoetae]|uniref:Uncharacterized protein n=1 Tax=Blattamonas nauphoetae TaxID=2049346 RepID=A0ABQ9WUB3_9EUKA|nr:hypothetical protein BLNAU_22384 [Blattamonas nauphoetae]
MLHFVSCATLLDNVKLTHHSQREINIDGGSLSIESSSFHDNTPNCNHFPSLRRNIHCSNAGHISIESLSSGDGSKDHPSPWISLNDCNMTGEDAKPDIPLFIPTLSTDSKSTLNKTNKAFSIEMKGTTLIPCGLYFEIVEVTSDSCSSISDIEQVEVLVCGEENKVEIVSKNETLFDRLHGLNKQRVDAVAVGKEIVKGLRHLSKSELFSVALAKWTPHWVERDSKDRMCIRLNEEGGLQMNESGKQIAIDDGQRWRE